MQGERKTYKQLNRKNYLSKTIVDLSTKTDLEKNND